MSYTSERPWVMSFNKYIGTEKSYTGITGDFSSGYENIFLLVPETRKSNAIHSTSFFFVSSALYCTFSWQLVRNDVITNGSNSEHRPVRVFFSTWSSLNYQNNVHRLKENHRTNTVNVYMYMVCWSPQLHCFCSRDHD